MVKKQKIIIFDKFLLLLLLLSTLFFIPFFISPDTLSSRDNDLGRTYIPIFNFLKNSIYDYRSIPFWRPDQMMGETLIGNALFPITYPLNILFLILEVNFAAVIYYFMHFLIASISTYYLARSYSLNKLSSFTAAIFYSFSAKMLVQMSAGHITMVAAFAFFPLCFLSLRMLLQKSNYHWVVIGGVSLAFMLILYPTIFYYSLLFLIFYSMCYVLVHFKSSIMGRFKTTLTIILMVLVGLGLSAIQLLPQLEFGPLSTRSQLKLEDVALPLWNLKSFAESLIFPYPNLESFDHESLLYLGIVQIILSIFGFFYLSRIKKIILIIFGIITLLFVAGLSTPIFELAYNFLPYLKYSRITTRLWFIVALLAALLSASFLDRIKKKRLIYLMLAVFLIESSYIGYQKILNVPTLSFKNQEIYQYLANDKDFSRIYCTTYCFNPQLIQKYNLQVLNGETPIQDKSIVSFLQNAGGYSYENFAVIFPPYQVWQVENPPQPSAQLLGLANVKYIASTYELKNDNMNFVNKFDDFYLYQNELYKPRAYFKDFNGKVTIESYGPNRIVARFQESKLPRVLVFSEKFFPGWFTYIGNQKVDIEKEEPIFRKITVPPNVGRLEIVYSPTSFKIGKLITLATILLLMIYVLYIYKIKKILACRLEF